MIVIYAEKPDMGTKIAAALDAIHLNNGLDISFEEIDKYENEIKNQRKQEGYFKINYNNQETYVTWGYGHMIGLKEAQDYNEDYKDWNKIPLPYIPEKYSLKLITKDFKQFKIIKDFFINASTIICATDNDREGDLIFDYIYTYIYCKTPFFRAVFNKQSKEEFKKAFMKKNLLNSIERINVIYAARARAIGDYIVGLGPTVAMTLKHKNNGTLSVGRVQTAVLTMIVYRENEIKHFKAEDYWMLKAHFETDKNVKYEGIYIEKKIKSKDYANEILTKLKLNSVAVIKKVDEKKQKKNKPKLYSLAVLQMEANKKYGYSLKKTSDIADYLYEQGLITYPRTDSIYLPEDMVDEMDRVFEMLSKTEYKKLFPMECEDFKTGYYFNNDYIQSHYAIVPTTKKPTNLNIQEKNIYDLIVKSVITMLYSEAIIGKTTITTQIDDYLFITQGLTVVEKGFMNITGVPKEISLPDVKIEEEVNIHKIQLEKKQTEPPKRYTGATLLNAMINCGKSLEDEELKKIMSTGVDGRPRGLGRPSSQATIVNTLEKRGYIETRNSTIIPTSKGINMIDVFPVEDLKSAEMTATWEKRLDDIESGKENYHTFIQDLENSVRRWTKEIMESNKYLINDRMNETGPINIKCPLCKRKLKKFEWGFGCTGYGEEGEDKCEYKISNIIAKKKISDKQVENLIVKGKTGLIKGFTSKSGNKFDAFLVRKKDKIEFEFPDNKPQETSLECPLCGEELVKFEWGFGCSGRTNGCSFSIGKIAGKKFNDKQVEKLIKGERIYVEGLKSKAGNKFDAYIYICKDEGTEYGKVKFSFDKD